MRLLWNLVKLAVVLMIAIPLGIIVLGVTMGILGALFGLAVLALKIAFLALIGWGAFKLVSGMFGGGSKVPHATAPPAALPPADPYHAAALRELERELGER